MIVFGNYWIIPSNRFLPIRRTWGTTQTRESKSVNVLPTQVVFDNETIDITRFCPFLRMTKSDYCIVSLRRLAEQNIVLYFAKIDTHLDQVADVFYVTELDGSKIESEGASEPNTTDSVGRDWLKFNCWFDCITQSIGSEHRGCELCFGALFKNIST